MCPHTTIYVSSYYHVSSYSNICVLKLLFVLILLYMSPHTTICESSYLAATLAVFAVILAFTRQRQLVFLFFFLIFFLIFVFLMSRDFWLMTSGGLWRASALGEKNARTHAQRLVLVPI